MQRTKKIVYWIATIWLCLGMLSTGLVQLLGIQQEGDFFDGLGYPTYFPTILGGWKLLGVIAVLLPGFPLLKEWAYAGFFFAMTGALLSHIFVEAPVVQLLPSLLLLTLTITSWSLRPASRRIATLVPNPSLT